MPNYANFNHFIYLYLKYSNLRNYSLEQMQKSSKNGIGAFNIGSLLREIV